MRRRAKFRILNTMWFTGTIRDDDPRLAPSARDEMHTLFAPIELTDLDEAFELFQAATSNQKSVVEQFRDNLAAIDAWFIDHKHPDPSRWLRFDAAGTWSEVDTDWALAYYASPRAPGQYRPYRGVQTAVNYLEEMFAPKLGDNIPLEFFILRLRREYVLAIEAIERQDWETALFKTFEAGRLKQIIDDRHLLPTVRTGAKIRRRLRKLGEGQNLNAARKAEERRTFIQELLKVTRLTGGALVLHLSKKTGATRRTIQRDLKAIRQKLRHSH